MEQNYNFQIQQAAEHIFEVMRPRTSPEELSFIQHAFQIANEGHSKQFRKSGEPYILHPLAVARIVAEDMQLGANAVIAALLHDLIEDTEYKMDFVQKEFGCDVAYLVRVVTKQKKEHYEITKQVDNFKQMLDSVQYDIRAILIKLADRLHNMRTLAAQSPDKQMKIAGETDCMYAPLANRLGFYWIKTELENLSFQFRCPQEYAHMERMIEDEKMRNANTLDPFVNHINMILADHQVLAKVEVKYRMPYSIWRKMQKENKDFQHVNNHHYVKIIFPEGLERTEKNTCLYLYSILTDKFKEKPGSITNYVDNPKSNGYESFHVKLLSDHGKWEEVHICSERMVKNSMLGCVSNRSDDTIKNWLKQFKEVLQDIAFHGLEDGYIENVVSSFYNDDIMVFTPKGQPVRLPKGSTALDFAFEVHTKVGMHAKYAHINGKLCSIKTVLRRGDSIEIGTNESVCPEQDWASHVITYKAKRHINSFLSKKNVSSYHRCEHCKPIPGEEVIGFKEADGSISIHKRNCTDAIRMASQFGDSIVSVEFKEEENILYPIAIHVKAIDRYHLLSDIIDCITNELGLSIENLHTVTVDFIVDCTIKFGIHSNGELQIITSHLYHIKGVEEVYNEELD